MKDCVAIGSHKSICSQSRLGADALQRASVVWDLYLLGVLNDIRARVDIIDYDDDDDDDDDDDGEDCDGDDGDDDDA